MSQYSVDISESNLLGPKISLKILYEDMPETRGCEKCAEINEANEFWCCKTQNPSMYYVEFLYIWEQIQTWSKMKRTSLVLRSIRNYLSNDLEKGCACYDEECTVYERRPFNCRMYGIIPQASWKSRVVLLKKNFGDDYEPIPQCNLVETVSGEAIEKEHEDNWFAVSTTAEKRIGVPKHIIDAHDTPNGSYRTFHDHMLVELFPDQFLHMMSKIRLTNPSKTDIDATIETLAELLDEQKVII